MSLRAFHGGLRLPARKQHAGPIKAGPASAILILPLQQHAGAANRVRVIVGQRVEAGQPLAAPPEQREGDPRRGAWLHAPCAGHIAAIERRPLPGNPDVDGPCIVLHRADTAGELQCMPPMPDWRSLPAEPLLQRICDAGVVGLGGATFPSADKLAVARQTLIINGAECEPYIACDDALLRERAVDVIQGALLLAHVASADRIILAIEDSMPEALDAAGAAIATHAAGQIELVPVPTIYPEGGERQLIETLTGQQVPRGGLPRDLGLVVQNVATAAAAWAAVVHGRPMTRRIVSVAGAGVATSSSFEVDIGTPIAELVTAAGGYTADAVRLIVGGPMMGQALPNDAFPITKASNCVLVPTRGELGEEVTEMPCIRCGECARVCPARLLPQQLLTFARGEQWSRLQDHGVFDCIECGCCDLACPSAIPLVEHFRWGKSALRLRQHDAEQAEAAKARFDARAKRVEREQAERLARRARAAAPDAMAATLARARAKATASADDSTAGDATQDDQ